MSKRPEIGQEVVIVGGLHGLRYQFGYEVTKVTPSGQVTVKRTSDGYTRRFDRNLRELGTMSSKYNRDVLSFDVASAKEIEAVKHTKNMIGSELLAIDGALNDIHNIRHWGKETIDTLIAKIDERLTAAKLLAGLLKE